MGFLSNIRSVFKKHNSGQNKSEKDESSNDYKLRDIQAQLSFAEGTINLLEDRLEIKDLRGKKVTDVVYDQITAVEIEKNDSVAKDIGVALTKGPQEAAANRTEMVIRTAVQEFRLDFRQEPDSRVQQAKEFIETKIEQLKKLNALQK